MTNNMDDIYEYCCNSGWYDVTDNESSDENQD